jgi:hypothetical protein
MPPDRSARVRLPRVLLGGSRLELERDERIVAGDPRVMAGLDYVGISGVEVGLGAVVVRDVHRPGLPDAHVPSLPALGANHRLDALRPSPAGLERKAADRRVTDPDQIDPRLRGVRVSSGESKSSL